MLVKLTKGPSNRGLKHKDTHMAQKDKIIQGNSMEK